MHRIASLLYRVRLRYLFLATFALVAVLPAGTVTWWVASEALERELTSTGQKQRHLAQVVAFGLERYAKDVEAAFVHMASLGFDALEDRPVFRLARNLGFRYITCLGPDKQLTAFADFEHRGEAPLTKAMQAKLVAQATDQPHFLPMMADASGEPTLFIIKRMPDNSVLAGAINPKHIRDAQRAVAFGTHGHAVILDSLGQIVAHPKPEWEHEIRSMAKVAPAKALLAGETGYTQFFAPARDEFAMVGYALAERGGWGVMAVRPMPEIEDVAWNYAMGAIGLVVGGLAAALLLAFVMARVIVRPVERVARVAQQLSAGEQTARVEPVPSMPSELRDLANTINRLARTLGRWQVSASETLAEARASDQAKTDFLASMSHEFRTPLNAIIGFAEVLRDKSFGKDTERFRQDYAANIVAAGENLSHLVDEIMELSRIEAGDQAPVTGLVSIAENVETVIKLMGGLAERGRVRLEMDIPTELPLIAANEGKLRQALINLVSNAIKFTPHKGNVIVSGQHFENGTVEVVVSDTGIGMSARDLDIALTPFGRVEKAWTRGRTGTGLGLPLARRLVESMGGTFAIDSKQGQGTRVTIAFNTDAVENVA